MTLETAEPDASNALAPTMIASAMSPRPRPPQQCARARKWNRTAYRRQSLVGLVYNERLRVRAFSTWGACRSKASHLELRMERHYPTIPFERYADDIVCHCRSERQAHHLRGALTRRFEECGLELHREKTKIVYCQDSNRRGKHPATSFDFLGYTFQPRRSENKRGEFFVSFSPAISNKAAKAIRREIRSWKLHRHSDKSLEDLARMVNATIRGWINYYGAFYKSALVALLRMIDRRLALWAARKMNRFLRRRRRAAQWVASCARQDPNLFAHWHMIYAKAA